MTRVDLRREAQQHGTDEVLILISEVAPKTAFGGPCRVPPDPVGGGSRRTGVDVLPSLLAVFQG